MKFRTKKILIIFIISLIAGALILFFLTGTLYAEDYYLKKHNETFIDNKPLGGTTVIELWVKENAVRYFNSNDKDNELIIRIDKEKIYQVNDKEKTVKEADLKAKDASEEDIIKVRSQKTEKKKRVGEWDTYQVLLNSSAKEVSTDVEYWLSKDIEFPLTTRAHLAKYFGGRRILEELKKYPGYPIEIIVHLNVKGKKIDMVTRLVKFEKNEIDKNLFVIPSDYRQIEFSSSEEIPRITQ